MLKAERLHEEAKKLARRGPYIRRLEAAEIYKQAAEQYMDRSAWEKATECLINEARALRNYAKKSEKGPLLYSIRDDICLAQKLIDTFGLQKTIPPDILELVSK